MVVTANVSSSDLVLRKKRLTDFDHFFPQWQRLEKIISKKKFPDIFENCFDRAQQGNSKNKKIIPVSDASDFATILCKK